MGKRPIKFRAWHKGEAFMIDWDLIVDDGILAYFASDDYELMQYTGLKDEDGREIYEGDIVSVTADIEVGGWNILRDIVEEERTIRQSITCEVYYDEALALYALDTIRKAEHMDSWGFFGDDGAQEFEVIGNIYENPELLTP